MSKPMELIVYPTWVNGLDGTVYCSAFQHEGYPRPVDIDRLAKRFTDAELSAEHYRAKWTVARVIHEFNMPLSDENRAKVEAVERFATLPHYDEEPVDG